MDHAAAARRLRIVTDSIFYRGSFPLVKVCLIVAWIILLHWGERKGYLSKTASCDWDEWEDWPEHATPHHLVLLADPQLVDPHTYPGRPWPLDKLTVLHTDQYLERGYKSIQRTLDPDTVIFLGDLFDGGREWWTEKSKGPEREDKTWQAYGEDFWLREYDRWGRIFLKDNGKPQRSGRHPRGDRKIIASLPGNHDLGISKGVRIDVRERFSAFFGEPNRVDMIGNHSIVSVDTVSLTAKMIIDSQQREAARPIWEPADKFLNGVAKKKAQALERYLNDKEGRPENPRLEHQVYDIHSPAALASTSNAGDGLPDADVPTILLTHVPLYRAPGFPCGPLREKYPPSHHFNDIAADHQDERNSIRLFEGYQYQNVLFHETSKDLVDKVGNLAHVFSGDDHDYCEVVHHGYTAATSVAGLKEITVKSMSWAMGVRKPGFLLVSLWNPIDEHGNSIRDERGSGPTIQTRLCLLPDALGTLANYGKMFALTLVVLAVAAYRTAQTGDHGVGSRNASSILPIAKARGEDAELVVSSASSIVSENGSYGLSSRLTKDIRRASPSNGWAIPVEKVEPDPIYSPLKGKFGAKPSFYDERGGRLSRLEIIRKEVGNGILQVALIGFSWYIVLARSF